MVEHGGSGSAKAAPIARRIFDKLILGDRPKANENNVDNEIKSVVKKNEEN